MSSPGEPVHSDAAREALASMISRGEGEHLEFKREWPKHAGDLAKELAAFASSGGGVVLVGVGDDGDILGLAT